MHRVELKCVLDLEMRMEEFINEFLMHRVELKSFKQRLPKAFMKYVPNAPCGVEISAMTSSSKPVAIVGS